MDEPEIPPTPDRPRSALRRLVTVLLRGPLGCLGFLAGMGVVLALALPLLISRQAPGIVAGQLDDHFEGRFEVEAVRLGWFDRQRVTGFTAATPEGERVARLDASAPGLIAVTRGLVDGEVGRYELELTADLVRDVDGSWNLARALTPRGGGGGGGDEVQWEMDDDPPGSVGPLVGAFLVRVPRLTVVDRSPDGPAGPLELRDLVGELALDPDRPSRLELAGMLRAPLEGRLTASVDLGAQPYRFDGRPFPFEAVALEIERVPVAWVDAFAAAGGRLVDAVGPEARLGLEVATRAEGRELTGRLTLDGPRARLTVPVETSLSSSSGSILPWSSDGPRGRLTVPVEGDRGRVTIEPEAPLVLELLDPAALVVGLLGADGEGGARVEPGTEPWRLTVERLALPLDGGFAPAALAAALELSGEVALGAVGLSAGTGDEARTLGLDGTRLRFELAPGLQTRGFLEASIVGGGAVSGSLVADPADVLLAALQAGEVPRGALTVELERLPTATADAFVGGDGLLTAVLGADVGLSLTARPTDVPGEFALELEGGSELASLAFRGRTVEGAILAEGDGPPLVLRLDLTPVSSPRVVGPLLPLLAQVRTAPDGDRASLSLTDFRLPLDGDPRGLSADLVLDLGEVEANWLPALAGLTGVERQHLGPYSIRIREGRAVYEDVQLSIDGVAVPLSGSIDLATRAIELSGTMPVGLMGGDLGRLDPTGELRVPLRIGGTWPSGVELEVDAGALGGALGETLEARGLEELERLLRDELGDRPELKAVDQAVEGLLKGGLEGLFGRRKGG